MNSRSRLPLAGQLVPALLAIASLTPVHAASPRDTAVADHALAYYELGVVAIDPDVSAAVNHGSLGITADGTHFPGVTHQVPGAIVGTTGTAIHFRAVDPNTNDGSYATILPWVQEMQTVDFTAECWVRPTIPGNDSNNSVVLRNHNDSNGDRDGWVLWQTGSGYSFRMYNLNGTTKAININAGTFTVGQWEHVAVSYDHNSRLASLYVNGVLVGSATMTGNAYVPLDAGYLPSIGGFSNSRDNPFTGDIDEVAYYDKALSTAKILAHYQNGIDASRTTPYETLIANDAPVAYYHMDEAAIDQVTNYGSAGANAVGTLVNAPTAIAGPGAPAFPGFPAGSGANLFNAFNTYVELNNPTELNITSPVTLEAWVQPSSGQPFSEYIIGHGADVSSNEVFLRIENGNYEAGDSIGNVAGKASVAVPAGDFDTTSWIHLAATCSGGQWTLYRNGVKIANGASASSAGITPISDANWAIGSRGRYKNTPANGTYPVGPVADQRVFRGGIAAAGIYGSALTSDQILAHYNAGVVASSPGVSALVITQNGANATLTWTSGVLAESTDLVNWTDVAGATSPYTTTTADKHFYRLHN